MYCGKCGKKIPEGSDKCSACGWQKTTERPVAFKRIKKKAPKPLPQPQPRPVREPAPPKPPARFTTVAGCFTAGIVAVLLFLTGAVLLFNHRGFAWEIWQTADTGQEKEVAVEKLGPLMILRDELLSISAQISGIEEGLPYNPVKINKRLQEIEKDLKKYKKDPMYFRVFALHKSVVFQFNLIEESEIEPDIPPLPYSPYAPRPTEEYVLKDVDPGNLLKKKILSGGKTKFIRYGPALLSFGEEAKKYSSLYNIDSPKTYKYVEVIIEIDGNVELVEYTTRMLDDYRRAFPAFLSAEKEARKKKLPTNHFLWRDMSNTQRNKPVFLHRIFLLPKDCIKKPILEIKRQGSSKMIWVQY